MQLTRYQRTTGRVVTAAALAAWSLVLFAPPDTALAEGPAAAQQAAQVQVFEIQDSIPAPALRGLGRRIAVAQAEADEAEPKPEKTEGKEEDEFNVDPLVPTRKPSDPEVLRFELRDDEGLIISGRLSVDHLKVETEFGPLEVPIDKIRRFVPGLDSHPELDKEIQSLLEQLGSEEFKVREQAHALLLGLGPPIRAELARHAGDENAERARRIKAILEQLDEDVQAYEEQEGQAPPVWIRGDLIETDDFTIVGKINQEDFTVESRFGTLEVRLRDIARAGRITGMPVSIRRQVIVEGRHLVQLSFKDSGIRVQRGDRVVVQADGRITMSPWGSRTTTGPDGGSNFGTFAADGQTFFGGQLVGKIGSNGRMIKIGSRTTFTAQQSGVLMLAVAMQAQYGQGNYQFPGQYEVRVRIERP